MYVFRDKFKNPVVSPNRVAVMMFCEAKSLRGVMISIFNKIDLDFHFVSKSYKVIYK